MTMVAAALPLNGFQGDAQAADGGQDTGVQDGRFANGDHYYGEWSGGAPHGVGKYTWADGSSYEGDWSEGKQHGRGVFFWPSGACYQGEWTHGEMDGVGELRSEDGTSYRGSWHRSSKMGLGRKIYANGDVYNGLWKNGVFEGPGHYTWAEGTFYNGDWKDGVMSGRGTIVWADGNRYEGQWHAGKEEGRGVFFWVDGSRFEGAWLKGVKHGKGTFYPAATKEAVLAAEAAGNGAEAREPASGTEQAEATTSGQPSPSSAGERGEGGAGQEVVIREYVNGVLVSEMVRSAAKAQKEASIRKVLRRRSKEVKQAGETIFKGHRSYHLMLSLQVGIRYSVGRITENTAREVTSEDLEGHMEQRFPREGSSLTPPHHAASFKWKDYAPYVFRQLREIFHIDAADYMLSLCGSDALRELPSSGKSGSVFFLSADDRFLIKTMRKGEMHALLRMLPSYYQHVRTYENTLLTKFFGLHRIKPHRGRKVRFMVMGNLFHTDLRIAQRFDLKGSSAGRSADKTKIDETTTFKDLDLQHVFKLETGWRSRLLKQLKHDCGFLERLHIMDYSLLLGVHFRSSPSSGGEASGASEGGVPEVAAMAPDRTATLRPVLGSQGGTDALAYTFGRPSVQLGVNMAATALEVSTSATDGGEVNWTDAKDVVLYFGIIDILQEWDVTKRIEHAMKSMKFDGNAISAVDPRQYSKRFQDYIASLFL